MPTYQLVSYFRNCPKERKTHGKVTQLELRTTDGLLVRKWFKCRKCTPPSLIVPETAREAYEIWQQYGKENAFREVPRKKKVLSTFTPEEAVV